MKNNVSYFDPVVGCVITLTMISYFGGAFVHFGIPGIKFTSELCVLCILKICIWNKHVLSFCKSYGYDDPFDFFNYKPAFAWIFTVTCSL